VLSLNVALPQNPRKAYELGCLAVIGPSPSSGFGSLIRWESLPVGYRSVDPAGDAAESVIPPVFTFPFETKFEL